MVSVLVNGNHRLTCVVLAVKQRVLQNEHTLSVKVNVPVAVLTAKVLPTTHLIAIVIIVGHTLHES